MVRQLQFTLEMCFYQPAPCCCLLLVVLCAIIVFYTLVPVPFIISVFPVPLSLDREASTGTVEDSDETTKIQGGTRTPWYWYQVQGTISIVWRNSVPVRGESRIGEFFFAFLLLSDNDVQR